MRIQKGNSSMMVEEGVLMIFRAHQVYRSFPPSLFPPLSLSPSPAAQVQRGRLLLDAQAGFVAGVSMVLERKRESGKEVPQGAAKPVWTGTWLTQRWNQTVTPILMMLQKAAQGGQQKLIA